MVKWPFDEAAARCLIHAKSLAPPRPVMHHNLQFSSQRSGEHPDGTWSVFNGTLQGQPGEECKTVLHLHITAEIGGKWKKGTISLQGCKATPPLCITISAALG